MGVSFSIINGYKYSKRRIPDSSEMKKVFIFLVIVGMVMGMILSSFGADGVKPRIIDVRTQAEWNDGHINGAILIPYDVIGDRMGTVAKDKSQRIYVYCRSGRRSKIAKESLKKLGYKDIVNLGSLEDAAKTLKLKIVK
jgi:phage shock protein E